MNTLLAIFIIVLVAIVIYYISRAILVPHCPKCGLKMEEEYYDYETDEYVYKCPIHHNVEGVLQEH